MQNTLGSYINYCERRFNTGRRWVSIRLIINKKPDHKWGQPKLDMEFVRANKTVDNKSGWEIVSMFFGGYSKYDMFE